MNIKLNANSKRARQVSACFVGARVLDVTMAVITGHVSTYRGYLFVVSNPCWDRLPHVTLNAEDPAFSGWAALENCVPCECSGGRFFVDESHETFHDQRHRLIDLLQQGYPAHYIHVECEGVGVVE